MILLALLPLRMTSTAAHMPKQTDTVDILTNVKVLGEYVIAKSIIDLKNKFPCRLSQRNSDIASMLQVALA